MAADVFIRCEGLVKIYMVANLEVFALQGLDLRPLMPNAGRRGRQRQR